ncbi:MAG: hypothetical protein P1S60_19085 [Anaerolineae bacterium]|nr:hypothetical protein [Anaerolineae bacterium]
MCVPVRDDINLYLIRERVIPAKAEMQDGKGTAILSLGSAAQARNIPSMLY